MGVLQEVACPVVLEADALALADAVVENQTGNEDGGKHRGYDTDDKGGCEALDRT